jgi:hypothetical protein
LYGFRVFGQLLLNSENLRRIRGGAAIWNFYRIKKRLPGGSRANQRGKKTLSNLQGNNGANLIEFILDIRSGFLEAVDQLTVGTFETDDSLAGTNSTASLGAVAIHFTGQTPIQIDHHQGESQGIGVRFRQA